MIWGTPRTCSHDPPPRLQYAGDFEFGGGETKEELAAQVRRLQTDNMRRKPIEADLAPKKVGASLRVPDDY